MFKVKEEGVEESESREYSGLHVPKIEQSESVIH